MLLRSARLIGDPALESCLAGHRRILAPDEGLTVKRIQQALIDLEDSVGAHGADGIFGPETGTAVVAYKTPDVVMEYEALLPRPDQSPFEPLQLG